MYKKILKVFKNFKNKTREFVGNSLKLHKIFKIFKKTSIFCPKFDNFCKINTLEISSKLRSFFKLFFIKNVTKIYKKLLKNF